ncbi:MAG: hypothetical protein IT419_04805 [Planctomycetes bacterium]|nr:hypothetical protein [Planctomycetota bacterium]
MNELDQAYRRLGFEVVALEREKANHRRTVSVLRMVKSGEIDLERLTVHEDGWTLKPAGDGIPVMGPTLAEQE